MGRLLIFLLLFAAFCLGAAISFYNWSAVTFHYLAGSAELPLIALLLGAFLLGAAVMWLLDLARLFVLSRESRRQQRQILQLEAELKSLRNLPLAPGAAPPSDNTPSKNA
ncbi:MAG: lipopolysaccharide assembly protein LapA domain-containing protein [Nevskiaceae bacterium]